MTNWTFKTSRFEAQLLGEGDQELYASLYTDPQVMAHIGPPLTRERAEAAFVRVCRGNEHPSGRMRCWRLSHRESGDVVGVVALSCATDNPSRAELGIMLLPAWHARGVTTAVLKTLVDVVMRDDWCLGIVELIGRHAAGNRAARVIQVLGFDEAPGPGEYVEWRLTRARWQASLGTRTVSERTDH